jgi:hypothetical protein
MDAENYSRKVGFSGGKVDFRFGSRGRILVDGIDAEKVPFQQKGRLFGPNSRLSIRKADFSAKKLPSQHPYILFEFGVQIQNTAKRH